MNKYLERLENVFLDAAKNRSLKNCNEKYIILYLSDAKEIVKILSDCIIDYESGKLD